MHSPLVSEKSPEKRPQPPVPSEPAVRSRRRLATILGAVAVLAAAIVCGVVYVDRVGSEFFTKGRDVLVTLSRTAAALRFGDTEAVRGYYSPEFSGQRLGLNDRTLSSDRDGIRVYAFGQTEERARRDDAISEWRTYLDGFSEVEEVGLHIHRMERWEGEDVITATVRFELIGTPRGEALSGIDRALFRMSFEDTESGWVIRSAKPVEGHRTINSTRSFVDVADEVGVAFLNRYYPSFLTEPLKFGMLRYGPAGITAADYDGDGYCDLFIPDGVESRLFRNRHDGTFEDVTIASGLSGLDGVSVGLFADYDNDGHRDFFVSRTFSPNQLYRNNGDGTFADVTEASGIGVDNCTTVASWADYDNDGDLDLYVGRYLDPRERIPTTFYARNGEPNQLYRNNGDGTFTNVTDEAGVGEVGLCLGTAFGDVNDDGYPDLYVSNDFGRKTLYRNNGDGTFDDVTVASGALAYGAGMSSTIGDYDNDGLLDLYVAHIRSEEGWFAEWPTVMRYMVNSWRQSVWLTDMPLYFEIFRQSGLSFVQVFQDMASGNTLLRNRGDGTFEDVTWAAHANPPGWFWGTNLADFDNDGWQDLYAANGWVYNDRGTEIELDFLNSVVSEQKLYKTGYLFDPNYFGKRSWHGWERNRFLRNDGDGTFTELGRAVNADLVLNSRGTAVADFWNRGVLDIAVAASTAKHALLRNNLGTGRNWLALDLVGGVDETAGGSNRDAVGARAIVRIDERRLVREVMLGDSYASQSGLRLYFGLGDAERVDELIVRWPRSGREQRFENIEVNRFFEVTEGREALLEKQFGRVDE